MAGPYEAEYQKGVGSALELAIMWYAPTLSQCMYINICTYIHSLASCLLLCNIRKLSTSGAIRLTYLYATLLDVFSVQDASRGGLLFSEPQMIRSEPGAYRHKRPTAYLFTQQVLDIHNNLLNTSSWVTPDDSHMLGSFIFVLVLFSVNYVYYISTLVLMN